MPRPRPTALTATGLALAALAATAGCGVLGDDPADIQVYSARQYGVESAFDDFTEQTGKTVEFIFAEDAALLARLQAEGDESPADVFITVDAGALWNAEQAGVFAPTDSAVIEEAVPAEYRDPEGLWTSLALRARTVIYNPDRVDPADFDPVDTYGSLADPQWRDRVCMRDAEQAYTQSLVAQMIAERGEEATREVVDGWLANGTEIMSNDVALIEAVDAGTCDVAIVNHYYLARELEERDLDVELFWASQEGTGTHVNVSGAGVVATSDNPTDAQELVEWLATEGQTDFLAGNHEFPVNPAVEPDELAAAFGEFEPAPFDPEAYGAGNATAVELLAEAGYE